MRSGLSEVALEGVSAIRLDVALRAPDGKRVDETSDIDARHMARAMDLARAAADAGEVPVGAVVVRDGEVIGEGANRTLTDTDPTAHAEIVAMRAAAHDIGNHRLTGSTLYVTLEPCTMCAGAISHARVARVVYGVSDPKGGAVESGARFFEAPTCHHRPDVVSGVEADAASEMLRGFFRARRKSRKTKP